MMTVPVAVFARPTANDHLRLSQSNSPDDFPYQINPAPLSQRIFPCLAVSKIVKRSEQGLPTIYGTCIKAFPSSVDAQCFSLVGSNPILTTFPARGRPVNYTYSELPGHVSKQANVFVVRVSANVEYCSSHAQSTKTIEQITVLQGNIVSSNIYSPSQK
jgi:hypothetical protein